MDSVIENIINNATKFEEMIVSCNPDNPIKPEIVSTFKNAHTKDKSTQDNLRKNKNNTITMMAIIVMPNIRISL
jgi:hypothetical protein